VWLLFGVLAMLASGSRPGVIDDGMIPNLSIYINTEICRSRDILPVSPNYVLSKRC
jgi:hypothetical protein